MITGEFHRVLEDGESSGRQTLLSWSYEEERQEQDIIAVLCAEPGCKGRTTGVVSMLPTGSRVFEKPARFGCFDS